MERQRWGVLFLLLALLFTLFILFRGGEGGVPVTKDLDTIVLFREANTVVVRYYHHDPYTYSAAEFAVFALGAEGKRIVLQVVEGNTCYTNEGNYENVREVNVGACEAERGVLPLLVIREGPNAITMGGGVISVSGEGRLLRSLTIQALQYVYPDILEAYRRAVQGLSRVRVPR